MADLPTPISRQDELLHNIADGTPDISDLEPISREEEYLKYIALNGQGGGGGGDITLPVSISNGGTGATNATNARNNLNVYSKSEVDTEISSNTIQVEQDMGTSTTSVMSQKAVSDELNLKVDKITGKELTSNDFTDIYKNKLDGIEANANNTIISQDKGTSATSVMSQKAVSELTLFGRNAASLNTNGISIGINSFSGAYGISIGIGASFDNIDSSPFAGYNVSIGQLTSTEEFGVAIGKEAQASRMSVALGYLSAANEENTVSFGDGSVNIYGKRRLTNVRDPINNQDAATKNYVDTQLQNLNYSTVTKFTATITTAWTSVSNPEDDSEILYYTQEIPILNILGTDEPIIGLDSTSNNIETQKREFTKISYIETADGKIIVTCPRLVPEISLPIILLCFR